MPSDTIQWFPGHMAKTRRLITENLSEVDIIIELLDARIPYSSANAEIRRLIGDKPLLTVFTKATLADPEASKIWQKRFSELGYQTVFVDSVTGAGINQIQTSVERALSDKRERYDSRGMTGRMLKAMIVGIPNVGKSSLINRISGGKKAKVENRPGVTLTKQWVATSVGLQLMDMPGVLVPKFENQTVGALLAATGAIKDDVLDKERIAITLCGVLRKKYPDLLAARYKLGEIPQSDAVEDWELFEQIGKKRGFLISGGDIDYDRTANMLLDEYRQAKIGRMTLELPTDAHCNGKS